MGGQDVGDGTLQGGNEAHAIATRVMGGLACVGALTLGYKVKFNRVAVKLSFNVFDRRV